MEHYNEEIFVNIGTGTDVSIKELAEIIKKVVGYEGNLVFNTNKPDGTPRKLMDVSKIHELGWQHTIELTQGITKVYGEVQHAIFA